MAPRRQQNNNAIQQFEPSFATHRGISTNRLKPMNWISSKEEKEEKRQTRKLPGNIRRKKNRNQQTIVLPIVHTPSTHAAHVQYSSSSSDSSRYPLSFRLRLISCFCLTVRIATRAKESKSSPPTRPPSWPGSPPRLEQSGSFPSTPS